MTLWVQAGAAGHAAVLGLVMCIGLAVLLPLTQVLITAAALAVGWTACTVLPRR